ncbi:peptidase [Microbispora sp. NBC_01189]|uniref:trypsin-like serine peptidase n=1 Tax=Microbispora sp. NBC_01189 TaxID=2903583 RepID=UPI002E153A0C|nr:peptidase [Microbispora sp. NBC_01189]
MHPLARRLTALAAPAFAAAAVVLATLPAAAGAAATTPRTVPRTVSGTTPRPAVHDAADTAAEQRTVRKFWTTARMEAARPLEAPSTGSRHFAAAASALLDVSGASPAAVAPTSATANTPTSAATGTSAQAAASARTSGSSWTAGGTIARTTGRVFFTVTAGSSAGRNASCTGTAVTSANKSVVITAGHCVKLNGAFHANWVFVPGYDQGNRPDGTWPATTLLTTSQWNSGENMNYDVAAAVVAPQGGKSLTDVVGGQGVAFNQPRGRQTYAFGYPAGAPYDGSRLVYCSGRTFDDYLSSEDQGLSCGMTGGSSGGPWLLNFSLSTGGGMVNSVNSFKYNFAPSWMFGPYFGPEAEAVYTTAQNTAQEPAAP